MSANSMTRWFWWSHLSTEKLEAWLEAQAAQGWHLARADRLLLRCHFRLGEPKTVRYCVDYPDETTDEYYTIFNDAGWELVASGGGWYIWRTEYSGHQRPELFNDVEPLIARNNRLLLVCCLALTAQNGLWATRAGEWLVGSPVGRAILVPYSLLLLIIAVVTVGTYRHNERLKSRRP